MKSAVRPIHNAVEPPDVGRELLAKDESTLRMAGAVVCMSFTFGAADGLLSTDVGAVAAGVGTTAAGVGAVAAGVGATAAGAVDSAGVLALGMTTP